MGINTGSVNKFETSPLEVGKGQYGQFVRLGRGIWDVAYFLAQNLVTEERQKADMNLLKEYHKILEDSGVQTYSLAEAVYDYRMSILYRFGQLIWTIAAMPFSTEKIKMHIDVLLARIISALVDHDCLELIDNR